ncbi:DUF4215 domain-containing protein, partial [Candidatus Peregrinibacteria bacterium]|nr:DUF4215 domain-containing protein [Candidatus Peregrinibacteria bacterium]
MAKTHSPIACAGLLCLVVVLLLERIGAVGAQQDCVGKIYGAADCPTFSSSSSSRSTPATCGDGVLDKGEECDDGSLRNGRTGDRCTSSCQLRYCGDGALSPDIGEECEPPFHQYYALDPVTGQLTTEKRYDAPVCGTYCTPPTCANGTCSGGCQTKFLAACPASVSSSNVSVKTSAPSTQSGAAPSASSASPSFSSHVTASSVSSSVVVPSSAKAPSSASAVCGNGVIEGKEQCDDGGRNSNALPNACRTNCSLPRCGDGVLDRSEECDDGNTVTNDACTNTCQLPRCGDGIIQVGEQCDDGPKNSDTTPNACRTNCSLPRCGDGVVDKGEECDGGQNCSKDCRLPHCGNGVVEGTEQCDDGPRNSDTTPNACRTNCSLPRCGDGVLDRSEECDDGNTVTNDACTNTC